MRRIFITLFSIIVIALQANARVWVASDRVPSIGTIIVKKNSLPGNIQFKTVNAPSDNRYAIADNAIQINSADLIYTSNDHEVAYVISREIGEIIVKNINPKSKFYSSKEIDAMGIDLMINSGYNPLAGIAVNAKMPDLDSERVQYIYDYLSYNYPSKIVSGYNSQEYTSFLNNIQPQLKERSLDKKKLKRFNKSQAKINTNRLKHFAKFNPQYSKLSDWNITYELLLSITEPEDKN